MRNQKMFITSIEILMLLLQQIVDTASKNRTSRIVGGHSIDISEAKFVVQVIVKYPGHVYGMCGGSLVTPIYVITAAHCVRHERLSDIRVIGGATFYNTGGVQRKVRSKYMPKNFSWDIAVLRLQKRLTGSNIETIKLCNTRFQKTDVLKVYGWGQSSEEDILDFPSNPPQLKQVQLPFVDYQECALYFNYSVIPKYYFCAGVPDKMGSFFGDSGGPAVLNNQLCGVVSGGDHRPGIGFYVDINYSKSFIRRYIKSQFVK